MNVFLGQRRYVSPPPPLSACCIVEVNVKPVYCLVKAFDPCTKILVTPVHMQEGNTAPPCPCIHTGTLNLLVSPRHN